MALRKAAGDDRAGRDDIVAAYGHALEHCDAAACPYVVTEDYRPRSVRLLSFVVEYLVEVGIHDKYIPGEQTVAAECDLPPADDLSVAGDDEVVAEGEHGGIAADAYPAAPADARCAPDAESAIYLPYCPGVEPVLSAQPVEADPHHARLYWRIGNYASLHPVEHCPAVDEEGQLHCRLQGEIMEVEANGLEPVHFRKGVYPGKYTYLHLFSCVRYVPDMPVKICFPDCHI